MGPRPSVVDVPHDVEMVYDQALDQLAQGHDELGRPADPDDCADDFVVVRLFVVDLLLLRDQLLNDIGEVLWQGLSHLGAGILGGHPLDNLHQPVEGDFVPVLQIVLFLSDNLQLFLRIIDQGSQALLVPAADRIAELLVDLLAHGAGAVLQHMVELLVLSVDVRQEMLRALWQVHDGLEVDDLRGSRRDAWVLLRQDS